MLLDWNHSMLNLFKQRVDNLAQQVWLCVMDASAHEDEGDYLASLEYLSYMVEIELDKCDEKANRVRESING